MATVRASASVWSMTFISEKYDTGVRNVNN
jgi:hypothetical protein